MMPARKPERDQEQAAVEAALRALDPDLNVRTMGALLRWLTRTARNAEIAIVTLDAQLDEINAMRDDLERLLARFARSLGPGRNCWRDLRQIWRDVAVLPEDPTVLLARLREAPRRSHARVKGTKRRARGQIQRQVANACAGIYRDLTGELPPVRSVDGTWGELLRSVFDWFGLGPITKAGPRAARELKEHLHPK
jgi:hypothetical protein